VGIPSLARPPGLRFCTSCHIIKCGDLLTNPLIRDKLVGVRNGNKGPMENPKLEFPEVAGKVLAELSVYDDPLYGREVLVRFTDNTQLSIAVGVKQSVDARYCNEERPDTPMFIREG
jgi:hypothetical protein